MTILVVADDEPLVVEFFSSLLTDAGYEVHAAFNGRDAIELVQRVRPALVITDMMMPAMSGLAFAKAIRAHDEFAHLPIILCSSAADPVDADDSHLFNAVLRKPCPPERLLQWVDKLLSDAGVR